MVSAITQARARVESWYERLAFPPEQPRHDGDPPRPFCPDAPFVSGINLPWLHYGCDVGASAWRPDGGVGEPGTRATLRDRLARLADSGHRVVRWFVLCDGRSGIRVDTRDRPEGLDARVFGDLDAAADELARVNMRAVFVLLDFHLTAPVSISGGVRMGGRRAWLSRAGHSSPLLDRVIVPVVDRLSRSGTVAAWDILNEPEWMTHGFGGHRGTGAVSRRTLRHFIEDATNTIHEAAGDPVTVGLASARGLDLVRGTGLDLYQVHWYDQHERLAPLEMPVEEWSLDRPLLLGEYPTSGSARTPDAIVSAARRCGYAGAMAWSAWSQDEASAGAAAVPQDVRFR
jgi:hypothetical protein